MHTPILTTFQISGADAPTFLQGLTTNDVRKLNDKPLLTACCNQKGRIIANFWIWREEDDFYVHLPESMKPALLEHLKKYIFRSKVFFEATQKETDHLPDVEPIWILPQTSEQFTPHMINLEKHGGVSFTKGCYLGQEIIARTEHLGKLKRHLYQITLENNPDMAVGDDITNDKSEKMGTVVAILKKGIFAVIEDRAIDAPLYWKTQVLKLS